MSYHITDQLILDISGMQNFFGQLHSLFVFARFFPELTQHPMLPMPECPAYVAPDGAKNRYIIHTRMLFT